MMITFETVFNANTTSCFICALILVVVVAVWLIIKQNSKLIEESVRPYITLTVSDDGKLANGFVMQNYGKTSAVITRFHYPDTLKSSPALAEPFQNVRGMSVAPGQVVFLPCDSAVIKDDNIEFKIIYHSAAVEKNYSETFCFKTTMLHYMSTVEKE